MSDKKFDYQLQLISRRWQYFASYLIVIGLISNSIPKDFWVNPNSLLQQNNWAIIYVVSILIIIGLVYTLLISLMTTRIENTELKIGENESIIHLDLNGKFLGISETILLYFLVYMINSFLTICIYKISSKFSIILIIIQIVNLFLLRWRKVKATDINVGKG